MNDDAALLRRYAEEGSEPAFGELVRRHVDLVYSAALRRTRGDAHHASDVAQQVFTTLAQQARALTRHPALSAWLHTATRNAALNLMISEQRRRAREKAALALAAASESTSAHHDWDRVRPVLDAAIDELPEADRTAVVLRFLERSSFSRVGAALRVTEDAARMRTERALEKLRTALARRGITSTAAALSALVTSQPIISAPLGLAGTLTAQSLATAGASLGLLAPLAALMNAKLITTIAVTALIFFGAGAYVGYDATARLPLPPLNVPPGQSQKIAALRRENQGLQTQVNQLNVKLTAAISPPPQASPPPPSAAPVVRSPFDEAEKAVLRSSQAKATLNNLRQLSAAARQFRLENGRSPASIDELVGETKYIRHLNPVNGESYANLSFASDMPLTVYAADGTAITYGGPTEQTTVTPISPTLSPAERSLSIAANLGPKVGPSFQRAMTAFQAANAGELPKNPQALLPYFPSTQEAADFVEAMDASFAKR